VVARGPAGERLIKAADLFKGLLATSLADDELIVEVRLALMPAREFLNRESGAEISPLLL